MKRQAEEFWNRTPKAGIFGLTPKFSIPKYFSSPCSDFFIKKMLVYINSTHQNTTNKFLNLVPEFGIFGLSRKKIYYKGTVNKPYLSSSKINIF